MRQLPENFFGWNDHKSIMLTKFATLAVAMGCVVMVLCGPRIVSWVLAVHALQLVGAALLVGFAVSLLWSEAQLVELNSQIQSAKAELVSEQSQYTYYNSALNSRTNITSVEETATRLGLMKIDQSQITYIRLDEGSVLVRKASAVRQWSDLLHDGAMTILASVRTAK